MQHSENNDNTIISLGQNITINQPINQFNEIENSSTNIENSSICLIQLVDTTMNKRQFFQTEVYSKVNNIIEYKIIPKKIKFKFLDLLECE